MTNANHILKIFNNLLILNFLFCLLLNHFDPDGEDTKIEKMANFQIEGKLQL